MNKYESAKLAIQKHGLELLTLEQEFEGINGQSQLKCPNGHIWSIRLCVVLDKRKTTRPSKGCPECAENTKINTALELAQSRLPENHIIINSFLRQGRGKNKERTRVYNITCSHNHLYQKIGSEISAGCPQCTAKTFVGQERVRAIFETFFQYPFISISLYFNSS